MSDSINDTPRSGRLTIGIYGRRNAGKSSLINAITGHETAIVSDVAGTTTDPVYKSISRDEKALELFYLKYQDEYYHIVEQKDETELKILRERISNDLWNDAIMSFSYCFGG